MCIGCTVWLINRHFLPQCVNSSLLREKLSPQLKKRVLKELKRVIKGIWTCARSSASVNLQSSHWMWTKQHIFQPQVTKWMQELFADALKGVLCKPILLVLGLTKKLMKSWAQLRLWAADGMCYMTKIRRTVQSRALHSVYAHVEAQPFARGFGRGMEWKNSSSMHNDKKCLALTFIFPLLLQSSLL